MAINNNFNFADRAGQLTFTTTISALTAGLTPQFVMPQGTLSYTVAYTLSGAGSLQMQGSCNNPLEVANQSSASGIPQVWYNIGTASTAASMLYFENSGAPTMFRGNVTGGTGTDVLTICISASFTA